jgi:hypothetical protein
MTEPTETEIMSASGCPVSHTDYTIQRPLLETCDLLNAERERGPFLWNDSRPRPFWMITDYEHVLEALQMPDVFSNEVINALAPEHTFDLLPQYLDPPEHTRIPDYELATTEQLYERGQQLSINRLPLRWDPQHREPVAGFDEAQRIRLGAMMPDPRSGEHALRSKFMLIFRGGAVARHDLSPSELQAHVEKWYRWSDELARQGRGNVATALDNPGAAVRGHERVVTDGPYAESKDLVTGSLIIEAASLEDAIDVARTCPTYEFGGSVEVRPVQDHRI